MASQGEGGEKWFVPRGMPSRLHRPMIEAASLWTAGCLKVVIRFVSLPMVLQLGTDMGLHVVASSS